MGCVSSGRRRRSGKIIFEIFENLSGEMWSDGIFTG